MPRNYLHTLLRLSLAFIWLWTGVVVLLFVPIEESLALMAPIGLPEGISTFIIEGTAVFEIILGLLTASNWRVREWALVQMVLIAAFTIIVTIFLPGQWLHPFGPISKNIPLFIATTILYQWEVERNRQRRRLYSFYDDEEV